jgi:hypothetical protein
MTVDAWAPLEGRNINGGIRMQATGQRVTPLVKLPVMTPSVPIEKSASVPSAAATRRPTAPTRARRGPGRCRARALAGTPP